MDLRRLDEVGPAHGFGIYVHWPYCARICPYCDFNVYAAKDRDETPLIEAICNDIAAQKAILLRSHPAPDTLYFGGGTPSLISPAGLSRIIATVADRCGAPRGEITLEANPNDITPQRLADWQAAGVTRLSIGVQSLEDEALSFLGRDHSGADARRAVALALETFPNTSIDLIYARPGQALSAWETELGAALGFGAPHLSLYELTIEERTAFGRRAARGELVPMDEDGQADLYELTQQVCESAGLPAYEISNHARAPDYESRHNRVYWNSGDWIGVGPGAHGRLTYGTGRHATVCHRRPGDYIAAARDGRTGWAETERLGEAEICSEFLAMGLRVVEGLDMARLERLCGPVDSARLAGLEEAGLLSRENSRLALTPRGRLLADHVTARLSVCPLKTYGARTGGDVRAPTRYGSPGGEGTGER